MRKNRKGYTSSSDLIPPRDELVRQAMTLWSIHGASWVTNLATYEALLAEKREKRIYPLKQIKRTELDKYPKIEFMEIGIESMAREYLLTMNTEQLFRLIDDIETALSSYIYVTIRGKITDYRAEIKRHGKVNLYAVDPDIRLFSRKSKPSKHGTSNPEG